MLAFSSKTKTIDASVPNKVNLYLKSYFEKEITFFEKKYKFKINITADSQLIIPEYKIHLLNKNKKIIEKFENLKNINESNGNNVQKNKVFTSEKSKKKKDTLGRILWVRKKRRKSN